MRQRNYALEAKTSVAVGASKTVQDLREKYVHISGTFVATMNIEVSLDGGVNFISVATVSAVGLTAIPHPATHMRINTTAFTSGVPGAVIAGFDDNG